MFGSSQTRLMLSLLVSSALLLILAATQTSLANAADHDSQSSTLLPKLDLHDHDSNNSEDDDDDNDESSVAGHAAGGKSRSSSDEDDDDYKEEDSSSSGDDGGPKVTHHHHFHVHAKKAGPKVTTTTKKPSDDDADDNEEDNDGADDGKPRADLEEDELDSVVASTTSAPDHGSRADLSKSTSAPPRLLAVGPLKSTAAPATSSKPSHDDDEDAEGDDQDNTDDYSDEGEYRTTVAPACSNKTTEVARVTTLVPAMNKTVFATTKAPAPVNHPITIKPLTSTTTKKPANHAGLDKLGSSLDGDVDPPVA